MNPRIRKYYKNILQYREAQLFLEALKLDIFSYLDIPITIDDISEKTTLDKKSLHFLLIALEVCGYIKKKDDLYYNTKDSKKYLSKSRIDYLGSVLLFRSKMGSLSELAQKIRYPKESIETPYDFSALAEIVHHEMIVTGRADDFKNALHRYFNDLTKSYKMLDLGGGSGLLAMEFQKIFPNSSSFVFETPDVSKMTRKILKKEDFFDQITVIEGNFNYDDIGKDYDMILASGIFNFITIDIELFTKKLFDALLPGGYLLIVGAFYDDDRYPKEYILNWMTGFMAGAKQVSKSTIQQTMRLVGFQQLDTIQMGSFEGMLYQKKWEMTLEG